jgi:hypothetical protein
MRACVGVMSTPSHAAAVVVCRAQVRSRKPATRVISSQASQPILISSFAELLPTTPFPSENAAVMFEN